MARRNNQEDRLLEMLNSQGNRNCCGECKAHDPTWASWNLGIFLCGRCASAHRSLGPDISVVKSLSMEHWSSTELHTIERIGNKRNNSFWNEKRVPFPFDPEDKDVLVTWLRNKYTGRYRNSVVRDEDYNLGPTLKSRDDTTDDYGFEKGSFSSRSYGSGSIYSESGSGVTRSMRKAHERLTGSDRIYQGSRNASWDRPSSRSRNDYSDDQYSNRISRASYSRSFNDNSNDRLSFRSPTSSEKRKYGDQSRKMKYDMGYEDEDANIEALVLSKGNINKAIDIIKRSGSSSSIRNNNDNKVPTLPQRRATAGSLFDSSKAGGFDWLGDASNATANNNGSTSLIDLDSNEQIYQYVDPNTGAVYYIDSNGQQYADPNVPQQQAMSPMQLQQAQAQIMQLNGANPMLAQQQLAQQQLYQQQLEQQQMYQQQQQQLQMQQMQQQQPALNRAPTLAELQQQQQLQQIQQQTGAYPVQQQGYFQGF